MKCGQPSIWCHPHLQPMTICEQKFTMTDYFDLSPQMVELYRDFDCVSCLLSGTSCCDEEVQNEG